MKNPTSVAGIIFRHNKTEVLLIKRRDVPVWVLPGGGLEPDEPPEIGAERETEEETGFKLKLNRLVGIFLPKNRLTKATYLYEFDIVGGTMYLGDETQDIKYFNIKNLPSLMPPPYQEWILEASKNHSSPIKKITASVTYLTLAQKLIMHPLLVIQYFILKLNKLLTKSK